MTQNSTTWHTRAGQPLSSDLVTDENQSKGTAKYSHIEKCFKCGGEGGSPAWNFTGWTCFRCGGTGYESLRVDNVYTTEKLAKLNATAEKAHVKRVAKIRQIESERREFERAAWTIWCETNKELVGDIRSFAENNDFLGSLAEQIDQIKILSDRQAEAAIKSVEIMRLRDNARATALLSEHVGEIGDRLVFTLTVNRIINVSNLDAFPPIRKFIHLCNDHKGNSIVYIGGSNAIPGTGETVTVKATVEAHKERDGVKQTVISRPKAITQKES